MTLTSKFHPVNAILFPILLVFILCALSWLIAFLSFLDLSNGKVDSILNTPIYGAIILQGTVVFLVYFYFKTLKKIQITNQGIKLSTLLSSEFIPWSEVEKIDLTGKSQIMMTPLESTSISLKTGKKKDIIAAYYENMPNLRTTLEQASHFLTNNESVDLKSTTSHRKLISAPLLNFNEMKKYSGNHFLSFNGLMIYGWIGFLFFLTFKTGIDFNLGFGLVLFLASLLFFYGFFGYQLHYFYLDKKHLVIKNHVWPWRKFVYSLADIKEVVFEIPYRKSISLRVITKDYQSNLYPSGSLRQKTWKALKNDLRIKKIKVRNEAL